MEGHETENPGVQKDDIDVKRHVASGLEGVARFGRETGLCKVGI